MPRKKAKQSEVKPQHIRLTVRLTLDAYDAITQVQHQHRRATGKNLPLWQIIDRAIQKYGQAQASQEKT